MHRIWPLARAHRELKDKVTKLVEHANPQGGVEFWDEKYVVGIRQLMDCLHAFLQGDVSYDWRRAPNIYASVLCVHEDPNPVSVLLSTDYPMSLSKPLVWD